ncbi:MAG TPA: shikimate dehydrogenase [Anaerolineaceae bacterium]|nr:shikimate dehydrogenase [Anaerolineaceae bacterium]
MAKTWHLGLTGWPLRTSLSPRLHQAALAAAGLEGDYGLFPVPPLPEGAADLAELTGRIRREDLDGINVTIPHKLHVIPFLDQLAPAAEAIGAVNTIFVRDGILYGDNTDAPGFLADLRLQMGAGIAGLNSRRSALVLGAGGSARAVAYALARSGWEIWIAARRVEQAQQLADQIAGFLSQDGREFHVIVLESEDLHNASADFSLVVNTTPLGMAPDVSASPWPADLPFPRGAFVYDLVYAPAETALVRRAREAGLRAANGLGMLVEQAAEAFERWTGHAAARERMRQAVRLNSVRAAEGDR